MEHRVLKYPFIYSEYLVRIPANAKIVNVGHQNNIPTVWAIVPDKSPAQQLRRYGIFGTGELCPPPDKYAGTVICEDGQLVWHVFEVKDG